MIAAISSHIWLLLTLRHNGAGLPQKSFGLLVFLILLAAASATLRIDILNGVIVSGLLIFSGTIFGPRIIAGWALISASIDLLAMTGVAPFPFFWDVYQVIAMLSLSTRLQR